MAFQPKTAKDLPAGAVVETFWTVWTKQTTGLWTNDQGDTMTDAEIDGLLARGGMLTRVPTGTSKRKGW
ncbi:hypothetical protein [Verrucosispora sp. NA02020]|uniref:hypothetical protein n=1 Tax=Verrucosispora sp. NA02020 TaxID=2742132 RepID=UPI00159286AE|nr:hypothetical protein [Verrucosispora sp. NA02020]QKW15427.1 hypothetical protein HUT12_23445 [Verrucosispora sp. NA02020]